MSKIVNIVKQSYKDTKKEILKIINLVELEKERKKKEEKKIEEPCEIMDDVDGRIF